MDKQDVQRILIVKLTAIGDVIHAMPVASALREHFPNAFIGWVCEGRTADLLAGHSAVDEVIGIPRHWLKSFSAVRQLRRKLRTLKFDTTIDLQGLTKSAIAARLSGARRRIGFSGAMGRELNRLFNNVRIEPTRDHVVDRYLELLTPLGIENPSVRFNVPRNEQDQASIDTMLDKIGKSGRFAVINPGAGWPSKLWPPARFAEVASHLASKQDVRSLVVWAGEEEHQWARQIVAESGGGAILSPPTSLTELAELCRRATMFVGSDTGPLHLAAAVGCPCVGLFGPMPASRNGPYGSQNIALQNVCLQGTSRHPRSANNDSMLAITTEEVCCASDQLIKNASPVRNRVA